MKIIRPLFLPALLLGACAIPNIEIDENLGGRAGSTSASGSGSGTAGTKNEPQGGTSGGPDMSMAGVPETGGEPTGGTTTGGTSTGGTTTTGGGGSGPTPAKTAYAKFCNAVVVGGQSVSFDLRVGEGANLVHLVAESGSCSPLVSRPCVAITTGSEVPIAVYDLDGNALYPALVRIAPGDAWVFSLYYDELKQDAQLAGKSDITPEECSALDFQDLFGSGS